MKAAVSFPRRRRVEFRNWIRCLIIVVSVIPAVDARAQTCVTWHSFSIGFQKGSEGDVSIASVVGQPFVGIQGSDAVILTSGFATFEGFGNVISDVHSEEDLLPATFSLSQNFPNPFNPSTVIRYELPKESRIVIMIYSLLGQAINTLVDDVVAAGRHSVTWNGRGHDGRPVSSGVYFYRMQTEEFVQVKSLMLLK